MTSEAKIAANRRNARRSTGPRTALAKARVRRNALRHGLATLVVGDPAVASEVDRVVAAICGPQADRFEREQALVIAEAQINLKRIRKERTQIIEQMSLVSSPQDPNARDPSLRGANRGAPNLARLLRLERYERRALSRRKRAVRLASL
jgi:hypothetical protein